MQERRLHERRELRLPVRVFAEDGEGGSRVFFGTSLNVSTGGALLETTSSRFLKEGNNIRLSMVNMSQQVMLEPVVLSFNALVLRSSPDQAGHVAVKFTELPQVVPQ